MQKKSLSRFKKVAKWSLGSLLALCLLITIGVFMMRDKVIQVVLTEVNKNLNTPVSIADIDLTFWGTFPSLSVDFKDVFIKDALPEALASDTLFYSEKIRLKFNPIDLFNGNYDLKKIDIQPGYAHIKNLEDGRTNFDILKPSNDTTKSSFELSLREVSFEGFRLDYSNFSAKQYHSVVLNEMIFSGDFTKDVIDLNAESEFKVNFAQSGEVKLIQNQTAYFDLNLRIDSQTGTISLPESPIQIANLPFTFALNVGENNIDVRLKAAQLQLLDVAKSIHHSSTKQVNDLQGSGEVKFDFHYTSDRAENTTGKIVCHFGVKDGNLTEPVKKLHISSIQFEGFYGNTDVKKGEFLELKDIHFRTATGPFKGNLILTDFDAPHYKGKANGGVNLGILHAIFPLPNVQSTSGIVKIDTEFDVKTNATGHQVRNAEGTLDFQQVQLQLNDDKRYFDHISGGVYLNTSSAKIDKLSLTVGKSDLYIDGTFENIPAYLNQNSSLLADVKIRSAYLDVQDFSSSTKEEKIADSRNFILPDLIRAKIQLRANNITYDNHQFKKISTDLVVHDRNLNFTQLAMQNAQADIEGSVLIQEKSPEIFTISSNARSNNISFQPVFKEWDNFQQDVISADQISGNASASLIFSAPFDLRSGIRSKDIIASLQLKIDDGRLRNVSTFKEITESLSNNSMTRILLQQNNIQNFEKNLLDLKFSSFQNTLEIRNGILTIPKMTIASNAMTINLSGTHDFNNQIDYHFDFNLRDIKKTKTNTEFGEIVEDGSGLRLFAQMFGPLDNPTIKWDREAKRELVKETIEAEKLTAKAMLKAEFGLFKKDSTVQAFKQKEKPQDEIVISFGEEEKNVEADVKTKKDNKLNRTFQKWKDESEKGKAENIKVF